MRTLLHSANLLLSIVVLTAAGTTAAGTTAASQGTPATGPTESSWPRVFAVGNETIAAYPPTLQSWDGHIVTGTCPIGITVTDSKSQSFGTMSFTATTEVNRLNRMVTLSQFQITGVSLPENPAQQASLQSAIAAQSGGKTISVALDRFEAAVPNMTSGPSVPSAPLANNPPALSIVQVPTVLVPIQGTPVMQPLPGTALQRVINTPMLLVQDSSGNDWLKIADGWMTAPALDGPWAVGTGITADLQAAAAWAQSQPQVNLLSPSATGSDGGANTAQTASLSASAPAILVTTTAAEVLVVNGPPQWTAAGQSGLLYVSNTSANIFQLQATAQMFVLVSGRWFSGPALVGPWSFVPPDQLPAAFMMIPADSPKENVLASIPGSAQAQEATIANAIPQMARVPATQTSPAPAVIGGLPEFQAIPGTTVKVLANCAEPVFETSPQSFYSVQSGVWFYASNLKGPWKVASWVPTALYAIPPSSPYYYVTFVRIYSSTPEYVLVGYTPGYFGAYAQAGVVVYGTGYAYVPYCDTVWVAAPMTYGCGAAMVYNPWAGWAMGFGMGMAVGWAIGANTWHCGPYPYWGPYGSYYGPHGAAAWGPHGWAATTGNMYSHNGSVSTMNRWSGGYNAWTGNEWSTHTASSYNSATGARAAGQTGHVQNAYTGNWAEGARGAGYNPTTGNYAAGKGGIAGTPDGATVAAGAGTIGNTTTGESASAAGVKTDNGTWGVAHGSDGTAVATGNNAYGVHDGTAYKYNSDTGSWQSHSGGSWNNTNNANTNQALNQQRNANSTGDFRSQNASQWQSGGGGFSGDRSQGAGGGWGGNGRGAAGGGFRGGRR
ncbi:MAG: hypothetical protein O2819_06815 [Planctomycetota bacterium]|nr:hypothetical protein [Planctomycetota bacterium]MDA1106455.1 hypothetical protein [Planctomycetota bacterium]